MTAASDLRLTGQATCKDTAIHAERKGVRTGGHAHVDEWVETGPSNSRVADALNADESEANGPDPERIRAFVLRDEGAEDYGT